MSDGEHLQRQLGLAVQQQQLSQAKGLADALVVVAQGAEPATSLAQATLEWVRLQPRLEPMVARLLTAELSARLLALPVEGFADRVRQLAEAQPGAVTTTESLLAGSPKLSALFLDTFSTASAEASRTPTRGPFTLAGGFGGVVLVLVALRFVLKSARFLEDKPTEAIEFEERQAMARELARLNTPQLEQEGRDAQEVRPQLVGLHRLPAEVPLRFGWSGDARGQPLPRQRLVLAEFKLSGSKEPTGALHLTLPGSFDGRELARLAFDEAGQEIPARIALAPLGPEHRKFGVFELPPEVSEAQLFWEEDLPSERVKLSPAPKLTFLPPESFKPLAFGTLEGGMSVLLLRARGLMWFPDCSAIPFAIKTTEGLEPIDPSLVSTFIMAPEGPAWPPRRLGNVEPDSDLACVLRLRGSPSKLLMMGRESPLPSGAAVKALSASARARLLGRE